MKLKAIGIKNFKGISELEIALNGSDVSIYGDNGTGKTTIADAFTWLLFAKDSLNSANFEIKPIELAGVETEVEAVLDLGQGVELTLKKIYSEKWTKKRGSATSEFTGHTIDHFVDGVPSKKKEFDAAVSNICNEDLFKLLTNPRYFNEVLHWQDRRKTLLAVCGDVSDADVIASDKSLAGLPQILGKHSLDDYRKIVKARLPEINRELEKIPVRIDELQRSMVPARDPLTIKGAIAHMRDTVKTKREELTQLQNGGEITAKKKELAEIATKIITVDNDLARRRQRQNEAGEETRRKLNKAVTDSSINIDQAAANRAALVRRSTEIKESVAVLEKEIETLRAQWKQENARQVEHEDTLTCPTCGQGLPEDKVIEAREKATDAFNLDKATALRNNNAKGVATKAKITALQEEWDTINTKLAHFDTDLARMREEHAAAVAAVKSHAETEADKIEEPAERATLVAKQEALQDEIAELESGGKSDTAPLVAEIAKIETQIEDLQKELASIDAATAAKTRIEELKKQERELAAEYEKFEGHLHLTEQFVRAKVRMLEENINSRFKLARFKLFAEQINGGLSEICDTTVNGVPYNSMNNASRINCGIDIRNVLSEHHGVELPYFVDNAESVVELMPSDSQQIRLMVSSEDKALRIEQ
jgi:DNA repair exonuclease SbcCD ATPase subunit